MPDPAPPPIFYYTTQATAPEAAATFWERHHALPAVCYTTTEHSQRVTVVGPIPPAAPPAPEGMPSS